MREDWSLAQLNPSGHARFTGNRKITPGTRAWHSRRDNQARVHGRRAMADIGVGARAEAEISRVVE